MNLLKLYLFIMIIIYFYSCIYFNLLPTLNVNMEKDIKKKTKNPNTHNFNDSFHKDKAFLINRKMDKKMNKFLRNSISSEKLENILIDRDEVQKVNHFFSNTIKIKPDVTDQKMSGRCWIFAFLNMIRLDMIQERKLPKNFQLSQNYLFFYDKLEKSIFFLQNIINTRHLDLESRLIQYFFSSMISDGGGWNMLVNLINKYGIVPESVMKDSFQSGNTYKLNYFLKQDLKWMSSELRNPTLSLQDLQKKMDDYIERIYRLLTIFLGKPPRVFNWEYYQEEKKNKKKKNDYNKPNTI